MRNYAKGIALTRKGEIESKFYILLDGRVNVSKIINNTEQRNLKELEAGDFFGEMALIHNAPRAASVTALEPVTVLEIDREDFDRVLRHSSSVAMAMVREISSRLRESDEMAIEDLQMRASELAQAYHRFYHLEQSGDNLFDGIGLGLAITQQVIKQHNGRLTVESEPGKGSTFSIHLKTMKVVF